mmetsp:Transcript_41600/g.109572  ORF Transcript_41600/g.109572 Transcript_41600/m.109572 type:complete len:107 (+) Transcript_41600:219-539(+)
MGTQICACKSLAHAKTFALDRRVSSGTSFCLVSLPLHTPISALTGKAQTVSHFGIVTRDLSSNGRVKSTVCAAVGIALTTEFVPKCSATLQALRSRSSVKGTSLLR